MGNWERTRLSLKYTILQFSKKCKFILFYSLVWTDSVIPQRHFQKDEFDPIKNPLFNKWTEMGTIENGRRNSFPFEEVPSVSTRDIIVLNRTNRNNFFVVLSLTDARFGNSPQNTPNFLARGTWNDVLRNTGKFF